MLLNAQISGILAATQKLTHHDFVVHTTLDLNSGAHHTYLTLIHAAGRLPISECRDMMYLCPQFSPDPIETIIHYTSDFTQCSIYYFEEIS